VTNVSLRLVGVLAVFALGLFLAWEFVPREHVVVPGGGVSDSNGVRPSDAASPSAAEALWCWNDISGANRPGAHASPRVITRPDPSQVVALDHPCTPAEVELSNAQVSQPMWCWNGDALPDAHPSPYAIASGVDHPCSRQEIDASDALKNFPGVWPSPSDHN
jgi:hypothetical protein